MTGDIAQTVGRRGQKLGYFTTSPYVSGRRVRDVTVLERICDGLGITRELMGLSYGERSAYGGEVEVTVSGEVGEDMQRRDVLAAGFLATFGSVPSFVALLDHSAAPDEVPLPSRLGASDVAEVRNSTAQLRTAAQRGGGQARAASAAAAHYRRFTAVPPPSRSLARSALPWRSWTSWPGGAVMTPVWIGTPGGTIGPPSISPAGWAMTTASPARCDVLVSLTPRSGRA